jgi:hypothetical protein
MTDKAPQESFSANLIKEWHGLERMITIFEVGLKKRAENDWKPVAFTSIRASRENCAACLYS